MDICLAIYLYFKTKKKRDSIADLASIVLDVSNTVSLTERE